jgi:uncharacterized membrane protein YdjX (TVP38/TMEM64 family)
MTSGRSETAAGGEGARSGLRRWLPLAVLGAVIAFALAMGWHRELTLENIAANRDRLQGFIEANRVIAVLTYVAVYAAAVALSLPGALFLTLTGGLLFGWLAGGLATVVGATIGATIVFLIARTAFGEGLAARAGPAIARLQDGFKENALSYLLFLRLVPAFPFFLVNLAPALFGVPLSTYVIGTFFGIIPGTFAYASAGAGLDGVIATAKTEYQECVAAKGAELCELSIKLGNIINTETKIAFVLLGVVALIPVAYKRWAGKST